MITTPDFGRSVRGIALNSVEADRLAALGGGDKQFEQWMSELSARPGKRSAGVMNHGGIAEGFRIDDSLSFSPKSRSAAPHPSCYGNRPSQGWTAAFTSLKASGLFCAARASGWSSPVLRPSG